MPDGAVSLSSEATNTSLRPYVHEPLTNNARDIRILQLTPGGRSVDQCLCFTIHTRSLKDSAAFNAISYIWGSEENQKAISINDKKFIVRGNCYHALEQLYLQWEQGRLSTPLVWIDSICIDQANDAEKDYQVFMMGDIYAGAQQVLACLGEHAQDSQLLVAKVNEVASFELDCDHSDFMCEDCRAPWESWALVQGLGTLSRLCTALKMLGNREYWTRIWIIQEIAKARDVWILCGADRISATALCNLVLFLSMEMDEIPSLFAKYKRLPELAESKMESVFKARADKVRIGVAFSQFADSKCFRPHDHLYGLLSLIEWPENMRPIFPAYEKSTFDLAIEVAAYLELHQIPSMLARFEVNAANETVRQLRELRWLQSAAEADGATDAEQWAFQPLHDDSYTPRCGTIGLDLQGNLTANLVKTTWSSGRILTDPVLGTDTFMSEDDLSSGESLEEENEVSTLLVDHHGYRAPRRLVVGSETAGVVCHRASMGDILVPLDSEDNRTILLVLRHHHEDCYDVIGQAVLLVGYRFGYPFGTAVGAHQLDVCTARIELSIAVEDAIILYAQDLDGGEDEYDSVAYWSRSTTDVSSVRRCFARVTSRRPVSAEDRSERRDRSPQWILDHFDESEHSSLSDMDGEYRGWRVGALADTVQDGPDSEQDDGGDGRQDEDMTDDPLFSRQA